MKPTVTQDQDRRVAALNPKNGIWELECFAPQSPCPPLCRRADPRSTNDRHHVEINDSTMLDDVRRQKVAAVCMATEIGDRVKLLEDEINNTAEPGLTGSQADAVSARLLGLRAAVQLLVAFLKSIGEQPVNPPEMAPALPILPGPFRRKW